MNTPLELSALAAFSDEFREDRPLILSALEAADQNRLDRAPLREAHRLIHALKGAASMVGFAGFGYLLNVAEELLDRATASAAPPADEFFADLRESMPLFERYLDSALTGLPVESIAVDLLRALRQDDGPDATADLRELLEVERREIAPAAAPADRARSRRDPDEDREVSFPISESRPQAPAPQAAAPQAPPDEDLDVLRTSDIPPELAEIFGLEAQEHLETIARLTVKLSPDSEDRGALQGLRRAVHTLKAPRASSATPAPRSRPSDGGSARSPVRGHGDAHRTRGADAGVVFRRAQRSDHGKRRLRRVARADSPVVRRIRSPGRRHRSGG